MSGTCSGSFENAPVVNTTYGEVRGFFDELGTSTFLGIPYANPPVGENRFLPPSAPIPWSDVYPADTFGQISIQPVDPAEGAYEINQSEDCLSLNIWTPAVDDKKRPVMVWIHPGGFITGTGSSPLYNGSVLSQNGDVVVVTINYRLGSLGFLYLDDLYPELAGSGNLGIQDQVAALTWIKNNIASFGGDPDNITIFGQSAGGGSVATLMAVPSAEGLFNKVISESGTLNLVHTRESAQALTTWYLETLGNPNLSELREMPAEAFIAFDDYDGSIAFSPMIDGLIIPEDPYLSIQNGSAEGIPLLTGTTKDEVYFWLDFYPLLAEETPGDVIQTITPYHPYVQNQDYSEKILQNFTSYAVLLPNETTPEEASMSMATDVMFWIPQIRLAELQSYHAPTFIYYFTWEGPYSASPHAIEIPLIFQTFTSNQSLGLIGEDIPIKLADEIQDAWVAFARTGNPGSTGLPLWETYDTIDRKTLILDDNSTVVQDPRSEIRILLNPL